jgi:hypothetical protein
MVFSVMGENMANIIEDERGSQAILETICSAAAWGAFFGVRRFVTAFWSAAAWRRFSPPSRSHTQEKHSCSALKVRDQSQPKSADKSAHSKIT